MEELRQILGEKRRKRGSVNFDLPESKIILDENGKPIDIKPYEKSIATNMIEEFMLVCNETIAENSFWQEMPFMYSPERAAEGFAEGRGNGRGTDYHQNGAAEHDAGKIYGGKWRTFWVGCKILLPLYLAHPQISRFGNSPHD